MDAIDALSILLSAIAIALIYTKVKRIERKMQDGTWTDEPPTLKRRTIKKP